MIHAVIDLTVKDCKNILLWYELCFKKKNKLTQADINTYTKMKALAISGKEEDGRYNRIRSGSYD